MKQEVKQKTIAEAADILGTLAVLNRGNLIIDAGRDMQQVIDGIVASNKTGEITIKLKIKPSGWDKDTRKVTQVDIEPHIACKVPKHDQGKSIFFLTDENRLTRDELDRQPLFEGNDDK